MLAYYVSQSNEYTFRIQPTSSADFTMSLQDMTTLYNFTASLNVFSYEPYESYISASMSISGAMVGSEYRAALYNSGSTEAVWHGTIQSYSSQSFDVPKSDYANQNTQYVSHLSENKYIIMD
jgi:hypothetical protein